MAPSETVDSPIPATDKGKSDPVDEKVAKEVEMKMKMKLKRNY